MSAPSAMERKAGWPAKLADAHNLRVRSTRDFSTGAVFLPRGTTGNIKVNSSSWDRLDFQADPCLHCGAAARVSRLSRIDFELVKT